jgi:hypothetical protein
LIIQRFAAKPALRWWAGNLNPVTFLGVVPVLVGLFALQAGPVPQSVTRLIVQNEVILRVPVQPHPVMPSVEWIEHKGPKCIPTAAIRRALLSGSEQVDFILAGGGRVRAELDEDCPALDFYGGFYLQPHDDELCIKRDAVHSRMGGSCTIGRFRILTPKFKR